MSQDQLNDEAQWTEIEEEAPQERETPNTPDQAEDCNEAAPAEEQAEYCNEAAPAEEQAEDCNEAAPAEEQAEGAADGPDQRQDLGSEEKPEPPFEETQQAEECPEDVVPLEASETQEHETPGA
ncbi:calpain-like cysteine peptidase, putative, partial [Leishmania donovani]